MKIKDVSKLAGLTEKTIRYYEEKLLIFPSKEVINGREFRSYSEADVDKLNLIANLRKLDFSISDIITMRDNPESITTILQEYSSRTTNEFAFKNNIIKRLEQLHFESITNIEDLSEKLKDASKNRPLPVSDIEFEFYKIDGLTKEELHRELINYNERLSTKFKKKIRNTIIFFSITQIMFVILSGYLWKATYFLGYIPSFQNDISWRKLLIPLFVLLLWVFIFVFVKVIKFISKLNEEDKAAVALRICRYSILVLILSFSVGIIISTQSLKTMEKMKTEIGRDVSQEWNSMYQMVHYVDMYLSSGEDYREGIRYRLYVNQNCYNFAYNGYGDSLHTKMYDLLISCYDPAFKELVDPQSKADIDKVRQMLKRLNIELKEICTYILLNNSDNRMADLTRYDLSEATELRQRINIFVDKYCKQAESLLG